MIWLVWTLAAAWFGVCCLAQLPGGQRLVTGRLVPGWAFFGPRPPRADIHVLVRDEFDGEVATVWRELPLTRTGDMSVTPWRSPRRLLKAVEQATGSLLGSEPDPTSPTYRFLLQLAMLDAPATGASRRFALAAATYDGSHRQVRVVFVSESHRSRALQPAAQWLDSHGSQAPSLQAQCPDVRRASVDPVDEVRVLASSGSARREPGAGSLSTRGGSCR